LALRIDIGASEAETFWTGFLRKLTYRGLRGVKLVILGAHLGSAKSPLHNTGNHRPVEPYSPHRAARRGDLTNPAQTGEGGDRAELVTPRLGTRPICSGYGSKTPAGNPSQTGGSDNYLRCEIILSNSR